MRLRDFDNFYKQLKHTARVFTLHIFPNAKLQLFASAFELKDDLIQESMDDVQLRTGVSKRDFFRGQLGSTQVWKKMKMTDGTETNTYYLSKFLIYENDHQSSYQQSSSLSSSSSSSSSTLSSSSSNNIQADNRDEDDGANNNRADGADNNRVDGADIRVDDITWELDFDINHIGEKSNMKPPTSSKRSTRNPNPNYNVDSSPTEDRSTVGSSSGQGGQGRGDQAPPRPTPTPTPPPCPPRELVVGRPNFQINTWNYTTDRTIEHVLADIHKVSHWSEPNTNIINIDSTVYITLSEHYEIVDPNNRFCSNLSDVERRVVCHGSRNEYPAAKLQRQLDLLYGLNLTILERQTEYKRKVRDAISRVIKAMLALGVEGVHALCSDEDNQAVLSDVGIPIPFVFGMP